VHAEGPPTAMDESRRLLDPTPAAAALGADRQAGGTGGGAAVSRRRRARAAAGGGGGARRGLAGALLLALAAGVLLPAALAAQQPPDPDAVLDGVVHEYGGVAAGWLERVLPMAQRTFALLATLELAVSGLLWALAGTALDQVAAGLLKKFIVLAFFLMLLTSFPLWLPAVFHGFEVAGQTATGIASTNPSRLFDLGLSIADHMLLALGEIGLLAHPAGVLVGTFATLIVVLAYAAIAAQLCVTLVEVYLVFSGGALFLGFAGFRATVPFAEGYLLYAFQTGAKVYVLYLVTGAGTALSERWAVVDFVLPGGGVPPALTPFFAVMAGAVVLALLTWRAGAIASRLTAGAGFNLREALR
jgi:type IV secretion system protein TrbL